MSLRDTALWWPDIPEPHLSFSGIDERDLRYDEVGDAGEHQRPLSTLLFGGAQGEFLKHITQFTVLSQKHGVMGIEVTFDRPVNGSRSILLGRNVPCRSPGWRRFQNPPSPGSLHTTDIMIDSADGEEITSIDVLESIFILCFKVSCFRWPIESASSS